MEVEVLDQIMKSIKDIAIICSIVTKLGIVWNKVKEVRSAIIKKWRLRAPHSLPDNANFITHNGNIYIWHHKLGRWLPPNEWKRIPGRQREKEPIDFRVLGATLGNKINLFTEGLVEGTYGESRR